MRQNIYRFLFNYKHLVAEQMCGEKTYNDTNHRHYIPWSWDQRHTLPTSSTNSHPPFDIYPLVAHIFDMHTYLYSNPIFHFLFLQHKLVDSLLATS